MRSLAIARNDSPTTGDFYYGSAQSDLGKTFYASGNLAGFGLALAGFGEGYAPVDQPGSGGSGVAFGRFSFAEATIGLLAMVGILWWYADRGMKA